jgi:hypothetical protein
MNQDDRYEHSEFNLACSRLLQAFPSAIGVAYQILDCGCAYMCTVSPGGEPMGEMVQVSGKTSPGGAPICFKCKLDSSFKRSVWQGIYWPGDRSDWPDRAVRVSIGQAVFGSSYTEAD